MKILIDTFQFYKKILKYEAKSILPCKTRKSINKKVLVLAPRLPPYVSGGVYRPISWAKYAAENNWSIDFLTIKTPPPYSEAGMHLKNQIPQSCSIYFIKRKYLNPSWKVSFRTDGDIISALDAIETSLELYKDKKPSTIIATGPSFDLFIAGYYLSKILRVPLILDYRDEWSENPFSFVTLGNSDQFWENRCLKQASNIIFTTESMRQHQINVFNIKPTKTCVIFNGWEFSEHVTASEKSVIKPRNNLITLMYCGMLTDATLPKDFLVDLEKTLTSLPDFPINFDFILNIMGGCSKKAKLQIDEFKYTEKIFLEDFQPRNIAHLKMQSADALVLFTDRNMERYIPGKLFDYLASNKPIIVHGVYGEAARIVETLNAGYFIQQGDTDKFIKVIENLTYYNHECDENAERIDWLKNHTRKEMAKKLFSLLNTVQQTSR